MANIELRAALAAYDAQYGVRPLGDQHDLPTGAAQRIEAVVSAARAAEAVEALDDIAARLDNALDGHQDDASNLVVIADDVRMLADRMRGR